MIILKGRGRKSPFRFCVFPGYNWCGPGCSGPGAPINDVDACCMKHDQCLRSGIDRCQCDYEFMNCLYHKRNPYTDKGRKAALMYNAMKVYTTFACGGRIR
ncbi:phospholipase [Neobacillus sedimentimangrovi]|uniref:phospholipase n=1 Tax=Neobacillus sedimentimangrovi TaxID=2699460 RepID=UPI002AA51E92|nr:phospholipase [Neobacillus sedimentimangrovi]